MANKTECWYWCQSCQIHRPVHLDLYGSVACPDEHIDIDLSDSIEWIKDRQGRQERRI